MPDTDNNGRVTLAVLASKLDDMTRQLDKIERIVTTDHDCLTSVVKRNENADKDIAQHEADIEDLKKSSNTWNGINTALAILGTMFASWLGLRGD